MSQVEFDIIYDIAESEGPLEVTLKTGEVLRGYSDCWITLPLDDDDEDEDDFVRFFVSGKAPAELIRFGTVQSFRKLKNLDAQ